MVASRHRVFHRFLPLAAVAVLLAGCASVPPPHDLMARAQQQLDVATRAGAQNHDPVDLDFARKRLKEAQMAMTQEKFALARNLAAESVADGRLAEVRSQLATTRHAIRAQKTENARLRARLLGDPASTQDNGGVPQQMVLPPATTPAPAASAPAAASSTAGGGQ